MIYSLIWSSKNLEHITKHDVTPEEVEEICGKKSLILKAPSKGQNPVYYVLGQTFAGRYLFSVIIYFGKSRGYAVTARDMTKNEKRRYTKWKNK
ncbi:MAG: BrnT family toxin [Thermodesulfobacteriota bacterium]|nr:BrnT family toxin [Thermodesulfobacteriota bacterium]